MVGRVEPGRYALATVHRAENTDDPSQLRCVIEWLKRHASESTIVFPVHPRTRKTIAELGLSDRVEAIENLRVLDPLGYLDFLNLSSGARLVLTDSGGIQEEATVLGVPCLTLRDSTERPITVEAGTNRLVGSDPERIAAAAREALAAGPAAAQVPELWDGRAAERIADALASWDYRPR